MIDKIDVDEAYPEYEVKYVKSGTDPFNVAKFMTLHQAKEYLADLKKDGIFGIISQWGEPVKDTSETEVEICSWRDYKNEDKNE